MEINSSESKLSVTINNISTNIDHPTYEHTSYVVLISFLCCSYRYATIKNNIKLTIKNNIKMGIEISLASSLNDNNSTRNIVLDVLKQAI